MAGVGNAGGRRARRDPHAGLALRDALSRRLCLAALGRDLDPDLDLWNTAKPFLETWMLEQVGPQKLWEQLKGEAPRYAKLIPELPRLVHEFLKRPPDPLHGEIKVLLQEQRRTNRLLQNLLYGGLGFVRGLVAMHLIVRIRLF